MGSFSHEAASKLIGELKPKPTITEVFESVSKSSDSLGVVPIENSLEGPVNESLDRLYFNDNLYVNYEIEVPIKLVLAKSRAAKEVERIYSHMHAIQEARDFLERIRVREVVPVQSTSRAAEMASMDERSAAICSEFAAKLYGLDVIQDNLTGDLVNITRFVVISKNLAYSGNKTMLFFTVEHKPGSLYRALSNFQKHSINLTMIYSRPMRSIPWHYYFFVEFEGSLDQDVVKRATGGLKEAVTELKIKGSYSRL